MARNGTKKIHRVYRIPVAHGTITNTNRPFRSGNSYSGTKSNQNKSQRLFRQPAGTRATDPSTRPRPSPRIYKTVGRSKPSVVLAPYYCHPDLTQPSGCRFMPKLRRVVLIDVLRNSSSSDAKNSNVVIPATPERLHRPERQSPRTRSSPGSWQGFRSGTGSLP